MCKNTDLKSLIVSYNKKTDIRFEKIELKIGNIHEKVKKDLLEAFEADATMRNEELVGVLEKMESVDFWVELKKDIEVIARFARFFLKWGTLLARILTFITLLGRKTWGFLFH